MNQIECLREYNGRHSENDDVSGKCRLKAKKKINEKENIDRKIPRTPNIKGDNGNGAHITVKSSIRDKMSKE